MNKLNVECIYSLVLIIVHFVNLMLHLGGGGGGGYNSSKTSNTMIIVRDNNC